MSEWEFDPEEMERQSAQGKPAPKPATSKPAQAPVSAAKRADDDFDFLDLPDSTTQAPAAQEREATPLLNDEAREKVALAASRAKAVTGEMAGKAKAQSTAAWLSFKVWFSEFQAKRATAAAERGRKTALQEKNRKAAALVEKKEGMRAPLILDTEELPTTPRIRTELYRPPNTKVYAVVSLALVALLVWYFRDAIPFLSSSSTPDAATVETPTTTPDAPVMMVPPAAPRIDPEQIRRDAEAARILQEQQAQAERERLANEQAALARQAEEAERRAEEARRAANAVVEPAPVVQAQPKPVAPKVARPRPAAKPVETAEQEEARMLKEQMDKIDAWGEKAKR